MSFDLTLKKYILRIKHGCCGQKQVKIWTLIKLRDIKNFDRVDRSSKGISKTVMTRFLRENLLDTTCY